MIPQSSLCRGGDGHGVTERGRKGGDREEEEVEEATTLKEEIRSGLERNEDKATENAYKKEAKV